MFTFAKEHQDMTFCQKIFNSAFSEENKMLPNNFRSVLASRFILESN